MKVDEDGMIVGTAPAESGIYVIKTFRQAENDYWLCWYDKETNTWGWGKGGTCSLGNVTEEWVNCYYLKVYKTSSHRVGQSLPWCRVPEPVPDLFDVEET